MDLTGLKIKALELAEEHDDFKLQIFEFVKEAELNIEYGSNISSASEVALKKIHKFLEEQYSL